MESIPWNLLGNASAVTILAAAVIGVFRGWLLPKSSVDALIAVMRERLDQERQRGDEWKVTAEACNARNEVLNDVTVATNRLLEAMQRQIEERER